MNLFALIRLTKPQSVLVLANLTHWLSISRLAWFVLRTARVAGFT